MDSIQKIIGACVRSIEFPKPELSRSKESQAPFGEHIKENNRYDYCISKQKTGGRIAEKSVLPVPVYSTLWISS